MKKIKKESERPLVSVVIPTMTGRDKLLDRALKSVNAQTYKNIETILVYDNPAPVSRNMGWQQATGKYIAFLDDDDEWDETKIAMQVELMEQCPECDLCITWAWDDRFGITRVMMPNDNITHRKVIKSFNLSSTSTYMVRKDKMIDFDESLVCGQEYDLAIRLSKQGSIRVIPRILMHQYASEGQISSHWSGKVRCILQIAFKHGWEYTPVDALKTVGLCTFFYLGNFFGNNIYKVLSALKGVYEG